MGYLMPKFDSLFSFILIRLFNGITTAYGLFNAEIWFIV